MPPMQVQSLMHPGSATPAWSQQPPPEWSPPPQPAPPSPSPGQGRTTPSSTDQGWTTPSSTGQGWAQPSSTGQGWTQPPGAAPGRHPGQGWHQENPPRGNPPQSPTHQGGAAQPWADPSAPYPRTPLEPPSAHSPGYPPPDPRQQGWGGTVDPRQGYGQPQPQRFQEGPPPVASAAHVERVFRGDLQAVRISHRYRNDADPALLGAEVAAKRGEIVALVGASGSGKSTLLKIIAGLYQPQGGAVMIDGIDIRQLPPGDLQRAICYLPQNSHLFHGTIEQNLRLADPTVSSHDLMMALSDAGAVDEVTALKDGLNTRIGDQRTQRLPAGLLQRLSLARVLMSSAPIMLLDEPGQSLDDAGDEALKAVLRDQRGRRTVIIVTHRPSHIQFCDRVVLLQEGRVVRDAPAADFLKQMKGPGK
mgnify:CR=1 FL=1